MLYSKNPKEKYTEMCKWFDENFNKDEDVDIDRCFKYIYLVYHMLAWVEKYFNYDYKEYDNFATYAASTILIRFLKKKEKGEQINSLLNYAKKSVFPLVVNYRKQEKRGLLEEGGEKGINLEELKERLREQIGQQYIMSEEIEEATLNAFVKIPIMINDFLDKSPYKYQPLIRRRIYMSCLLSVLSSFTLSRDSEEKIASKMERGKRMSVDKIGKMYLKEKDSVILWRLDHSMTDYIRILVNKVRKAVMEDLKDTRAYYTVPVEVLDDVLASAWDNLKDEDNKDFNEG